MQIFVLVTALAAALLPEASPAPSEPTPIYAVGKVTVRGGNRIRGIEDGVILNRRFDDDCTPLDPFPTVQPFAAALGQQADFEVEIISCPARASLPAIQCRSWIEGGSAPLCVQAQAARLLLPVPLHERTGVHGVRLECRIGKADAGLTTTLFLTYAAPRPMVDPPEEVWYRRASEWGAGLTREAGEQAVADRILTGLFLFGQRRWRYGLCEIDKTKDNTCVFGTTPTPVSTEGLLCNSDTGTCKLPWTELVQAADGERNFTDCYQFSAAFEYIAATMGIGGMVEVDERGSYKRGFMTPPTTRSLDPAFAGNLSCGPRNLPCAFTFYNHDLRQRGSRGYDATFGGIYESASELVFQSVMENTVTMLGFERSGAALLGYGYGRFRSWRELAPGECPTCTLPGSGEARLGEGVLWQAISTGGSPEPDALAADLEVVVVQEGSFSVHGAIYCRDGTTLVTLRPVRRLQDVLSQTRVSGPPGRYPARLIFSGSDLERSRSCAPFRLRAGLAAGSAVLHRLDIEVAVDKEVLASLAEDAASLGEAEDLRLAWVNEGLRATLPVTVRIPGAFAVEARLARDGETVSSAGYQREMDRETDLLVVDFPLAAPPPKGRYEIAIALHRLHPLLPVNSRLIEGVELPPAP